MRNDVITEQSLISRYFIQRHISWKQRKSFWNALVAATVTQRNYCLHLLVNCCKGNNYAVKVKPLTELGMLRVCQKKKKKTLQNDSRHHSSLQFGSGSGSGPDGYQWSSHFINKPVASKVLTVHSSTLTLSLFISVNVCACRRHERDSFQSPHTVPAVQHWEGRRFDNGLKNVRI